MKGFAAKRAGREGFATVGLSDTTSGRRQTSASMPIRSFTAERMRCLQPRYRSVVWIDTCPEQELNLLQFAARRVVQPSTYPPEIVRCEPLDASFVGVLAGRARLLFRQTFTPSFPFLLTRRNSLPPVNSAAWSQSSSSALTQSGMGILKNAACRCR
jgi:hypothetical protein